MQIWRIVCGVASQPGTLHSAYCSFLIGMARCLESSPVRCSADGLGASSKVVVE